MSSLPRRALLPLAFLLASAVSASPVAAAGAQVQVDGVLTPDTAGVCVDPVVSVATYTVTGDLSGCWYIEEWTINGETPSGSIRASGTEVFVGWLGARYGSFWTTYTFTYKVVDGVEVHGRCHHPIVDGNGGFTGVQGMLEMHDDPSGCAFYSGHLSF